jgi:hypothetical protein
MSLYEASAPQLKKMLKNLERWIEAAQGHAKKRSFDENALVGARLAPDQFAFARQVQTACDNAKFIVARLTGKTAPSHPDTEQTLDELKKRIQTVVAYLDGFKKEDFAESATRPIELPFLEGKVIYGGDYLNEFALPNFYFHVTTAYAILRHNGVDLGKRDFMGPLTLHDR